MTLFTKMKESAHNMKNIRSLALAAIFAALYALFMTPLIGNFVIIPGKLEIRFGFLILAVAAMYLGPVPAVFVAMIGDLVGTLLFYGGEFFLGYTFTWMLQAFVFGLLFYNEKPTIPRVLISMVLNTLVVNLLLTTFWQSKMFSTPFFPLMITRIPLNAIMFIPRSILLHFTLTICKKLLRRANWLVQ